jgi:hypothetical protein
MEAASETEPGRIWSGGEIELVMEGVSPGASSGELGFGPQQGSWSRGAVTPVHLLL